MLDFNKIFAIISKPAMQARGNALSKVLAQFQALKEGKVAKEGKSPQEIYDDWKNTVMLFQSLMEQSEIDNKQRLEAVAELDQFLEDLKP